MPSEKALEQAGFKLASTEMKPRLIVGVAGLEKLGKSHFAYTAPGPIAGFDIDVGSEGVVQKFRVKGKRIYIQHFHLPKEENEDKAQKAGNQVWAKFLKAYNIALENARTVVVDTATEAWEILRLARFGKLEQVPPNKYIQANREYREGIINAAYESDANLILIQKKGKQWKSKVDPKGRMMSYWAGGYEWKGFGETGFKVQVKCETDREPDGGPFHLKITDCRQNPSLAGVDLVQEEEAVMVNGEIEMIEKNSFPYLASLVFPDTEIEQWMT